MTDRGTHLRLLAGFVPVLMVVALFHPGSQTATSTGSSASVSTSSAAEQAARTAFFPAACRVLPRKGFWPTKARVQFVGKRIKVLALGRDRYGVPRQPPLTSTGKKVFGWDKKGRKPGSKRGNVRFNAHTWPDGSALGNRLLARLWVGQLIVVRNAKGKAICYRVTKRVQVLPRSYEARVNYYRTRGKPKLAIVVCSPPRLGPGNWKYRTIWYARPTTS